ncbi:P-II family nitrogen regulator [uncultured Treponema sp.]|uniref:P-II family nitrogen regulator n=1 Tax=uncultured Treponema sp. TaxID=162155 RepID=UPI0025E7AE0E|nr:P-II family nitrogen regulator [uncultured Treponema sp.]
MSMFKLIVSIVPHDKGEKLTKAAVDSGCGGGSVLMGRALAKSNFGAILGMGETTKDLIYMVIESEKKSSIINAIVESAKNEKSGFGELFALDVDNLMKAGSVFGSNSAVESKGENMSESNTKDRDMITVIVNKGYADDVMFAARKAGASGGTVLNARGTAREDDEKFFGVHIVPEKDMLIIIVEHEKKEAVLGAIGELKCLKEPGMGIVYSSPVSDFTLLGKK